MKKICIISIWLGLGTLLTSAQTVIQPVQKNPVSFVVIIDSESFRYAEKEVFAYRNLLENEGRSVYIIHHQWTKPEQVKEEINKVYNNKSAVLEGVVLIGDVPIVMVRNFQHATTVFRRHPSTVDKDRVTVPSDRYYDDPALRWRFVEHDEKKPQQFHRYASHLFP